MLRPIMDLWRYARLAAKQPTNATSLPNPAQLFSIKRDNDFGYASVEFDRIVFAFTGSNDLRDWIENLQATPAAGSGGIHRGFWLSWLDFQGQIMDIVNQHGKTKKIFVTGYSRGAALATLAARAISHNNGTPCSCITFGSPRVGEKAFRDEFDSLPINYTRVVNGFDLVTNLPPAVLGYRHCGKEFKLPQPWIFSIFHKIRDHLEENYDKALKRRFV